MITVILIVLAAVFKAVSDTIQHHFWSSVFNTPKFNKYFWNPALSWNNAKKVFKFPVDAWHISNSLMIVCFVVAAIVNDLTWKWYIQLPVFGIVFNVVFNLFWNKILKKKL